MGGGPKSDNSRTSFLDGETAKAKDGTVMNLQERGEFVDLVAQAVVDKIEERERVNGMVSMVVARVIALQQEEAALKAETKQDAKENANA